MPSHRTPTEGPTWATPRARNVAYGAVLLVILGVACVPLVAEVLSAPASAATATPEPSLNADPTSTPGGPSTADPTALPPTPDPTPSAGPSTDTTTTATPTPDPEPAPGQPTAPTPAPTGRNTTRDLDGAVFAARQVKPLQDLAPGDRVLYDGATKPGRTRPDSARPVCVWVAWGGSVTRSTIRCGTDTFAAPTARLTPVEPVTGARP